MKRFILVIIFLSFFLSSCTCSRRPYRPDTSPSPPIIVTPVFPDTTIISLGNATFPQKRHTLDKGESIIYEIDTNSAPRRSELIYLELESTDFMKRKDLKLTLYTVKDNKAVAIATSNEANLFSHPNRTTFPRNNSLAQEQLYAALDAQFLQQAAKEGVAQNVAEARSCRGPCIIIKKNIGTVYLKVETTDIFSRDYKFFAFAEAAYDKSEASNNPSSSYNECRFGDNVIPFSNPEIYLEAPATAMAESIMAESSVNLETTDVESTNIEVANVEVANVETTDPEAIVVSPKTIYALETIDDIDCFSVELRTREVTISASEKLNFTIKIEFFNRFGRRITLANGKSTTIYATADKPRVSLSHLFPERFIIRVSPDSQQAAPPQYSHYKLSFR